jgi:hypothetical protein
VGEQNQDQSRWLMPCENTALAPAAQWAEQEITALEQRLRPATSEEIAEKLAILFSAFPSQASGDPELRAEAYIYALSDVCRKALDDAVKALLKGEIERNHAFMPTPPELARICKGFWFQGYHERALRRAKNRHEQTYGRGYYIGTSVSRSDEPKQIGALTADALTGRGIA